jgi:cytochrome b561
MTRTSPEAGVSGNMYSPAIRVLHWLTAVLLVLTFAIAWTLDWPGDWPTRLALLQVHRMIGLCILAIVAIRLIIRVFGRRAPHSNNPRWMASLARSVVVAFYLVLLVIPLAGWAYTNASGFPVTIIGKWSLPSLIFKDEYFSRVTFAVHKTLAIALLGLAALHALAAIWHETVLKDGVFARMRLFSFRKSTRAG